MAIIKYKNSKGNMEELPIIINHNAKTAYDLAIECGFIGTMEEWLKSLAYDDTKLMEQFNTLGQGLEVHKNNTTQDIQNYKNNKNLEINTDLENYKSITTQNIQDYKSIKDVEIKQELDKYANSKTLEITENLETYKKNTDLEINKNLEAYKNTKDTEINQYKTAKDLEINTYINNKNTELDKYVSDKNIEISKDLENYKSDTSQAVEGNYISLSNTIGGYIDNVEILGNTIQSSIDLTDVQSVGTLKEDGLYKMSILSCCKNLFDGELEQGTYNADNGTSVSSSSECRSKNFTKIKSNSNYIIKAESYSSNFRLYFYDINFNFISANVVSNSNTSFTTTSNTRYIKFRIVDTDLSKKVQIEEGIVATTYEPYQYNKSSILLPCQLEKVGDVADRLFRRKDGVWCIEKNIGEVVLNGSESWAIQASINENVSLFYNRPASIKTGNLISNRFVVNSKITSPNNGINLEGIWYSSSYDAFYIGILTNKLLSQDVSDFKTWLSQNNVLAKYQLATPQIIELPLSTQIQLNSFNGITNIFTEDTVIEPTIKATVPKSLGASINSLVNKTDNLSQRVENVEKLKEGSELEITTDKGYVVCENTNNGYIEDLKIEGNTLVNLCEKKSETILQGTDNWGVGCKILKPLSANTKVTFIITTKDNTASKGVLLRLIYTDSTSRYITPSNSKDVGVISTVYTLEKDLNNIQWYIHTDDRDGIQKVTVLNPITFEGDHTQNPLSYFEGLKSVGEGVDKIEVLSCGKCIEMENGSLSTSGSIDNTSTYFTQRIRSIDFISKFDNYSNIDIDFSRFQLSIREYDKNKTFLRGTSAWQNSNILLGSDCFYYKVVIKSVNDTDITPKDLYVIEKSNLDKKQILFLNKDGNYEKPILRSTESISDTIEKHSDSKYYYHKRCGEVVLSGIESGWSSFGSTSTNTIMFYKTLNDCVKINDNVNLKCDKFPSKFIYTADEEGVFHNLQPYLFIRINKSKLTTTQDVAGFKTWLQTNPVTVVYQLATEEIYECVNLDLDSYEGETSVIVDSGAISPKITFKIASHIANTISVLKDRINYLEDKVTNMLKLVLAGDVQSLAYELYPQDFEKEEETETVEGTELL